MMPKIIKRRKKGFTLLETIIAILVLGITVSTFTQAYYASVNASNSNKQRLEALIQVQSQFERIRAAKNDKLIVNFNSLRNMLTSDGYSESGNIYTKNIDIRGINYSLKLTTDNSIPELIQIVMEVKPHDANSVRLGTKFFITN